MQIMLRSDLQQFPVSSVAAASRGNVGDVIFSNENNIM